MVTLILKCYPKPNIKQKRASRRLESVSIIIGTFFDEQDETMEKKEDLHS